MTNSPPKLGKLEVKGIGGKRSTEFAICENGRELLFSAPDAQELTNARGIIVANALCALSAQPLVGVIPEGMALLPKSPTREMLNAAIDVDSYKLGDISPLGFRMSPQQLFELCYAAMLAAAPKYPAGPQDSSDGMVKCRWEEIKPGLGRFVPVNEFELESISGGPPPAPPTEPLTEDERKELDTLRAFVESAFVAHPNLDLDITAAHARRTPPQGVDHD